MLAIGFDADRVERQGMVLKLKTALSRNVLLTLLNLRIVKFFDMSTGHADQMVVMPTLLKLEDRFTGLEMTARQETRLLKLGQNPVNRRQTNILSFANQHSVDILSREVATITALENLKDCPPGQGGFEPEILQFVRASHSDTGDGVLVRLHIPLRDRMIGSHCFGLVRPVFLRELIPQKIGNSCGLALTLSIALCSGACAPILPSLPSVPSLSSLTDSNVFKPFRLDIAQGNYLTRDTVERVRPGMRRQDVRFVLGSPLLLDPFHPNRWDYIFRFQRGTGESVTRRVTIHFDGDRVERIEADALPGRDETNDPALPRNRRS
jgi:outer membrane protein assembly factor BamE